MSNPQNTSSATENQDPAAPWLAKLAGKSQRELAYELAVSRLRQIQAEVWKQKYCKTIWQQKSM
ncbi:MAG: hypothetical protein OXF62_20385 [Caldilineaceae bacterium]|nr:hypothetical protein [Caldilineaceae bacterium]